MRNAIVLAVVLSWWTQPLAGCDLCADAPVVHALSPDGEHELTVTCRDCGTTTTWAYQVRIARPRSWLSRQSLVFAAETPGGCSTEEVRAAWVDDAVYASTSTGTSATAIPSAPASTGSMSTFRFTPGTRSDLAAVAPESETRLAERIRKAALRERCWEVSGGLGWLRVADFVADQGPLAERSPPLAPAVRCLDVEAVAVRRSREKIWGLFQ
jgi:hypothetical protein